MSRDDLGYGYHTSSISAGATVLLGNSGYACHNSESSDTNIKVVNEPAAPVVVPVTAPVVHERTVYVQQAERHHACATLTQSELAWYYNDLRHAKHTYNTRRIHNDRMMLESACRQDLVDKAIDG